MIPRLLTRVSLWALAPLTAFTFAAAPQAQIVFADFEALAADGKPANAFGFGDGDISAATGRGGTGTALQLNVGASGTQGFVGAGTSGNGGTGALEDISGADYLTFYFDAGTVPNEGLTLQVNLQEDVNGNGQFDPGAGGEDEFQAEYRIEPGAGFEFVAIPLASFTDDNVDAAGPGSDDGFNFEKLLYVVFAVKDYTAASADFAVRFDDVKFASGVAPVSSEGLPEVFSAAPLAFPNPTAGDATVTFTLDAPSDVTVDVVDLLGRRVAELARGLQAPGEVRLAVPTDALPAGLYVVRVRTAEGTASTRLTVVR